MKLIQFKLHFNVTITLKIRIKYHVMFYLKIIYFLLNFYVTLNIKIAVKNAEAA